MGKILLGNIKGPKGDPGELSAINTTYNNADSGLQAENVQDAIDEIKESIPTKAEDIGADVSGSANTALESAKSYTDTKISDLINGAPEAMDTLKEIADAMAENEDVVEALNAAIGNKASLSQLTDNFNNPADWGANIFGSGDVNTWIEPGLYSSIGGQTQNLPDGSDGWATVLVLAPNYASERITQICWNWNNNSTILFTRNTNDKGANWSEWVAIVNGASIKNMQAGSAVKDSENRNIAEALNRFADVNGKTKEYTGNLNNLNYNSIFNVSGGTDKNTPVTNTWEWGFVITTVHCNTDSYISQLWIGMTAPVMYYRVKVNGSWNSWQTITQNGQILNTATAIEASTSDDNIVGAKGLKEMLTKKYGTLTVVNADDKIYSYVRMVGDIIGILKVTCFAPAIDAWGESILYTSSMKPSNEIVFLLVRQDDRQVLRCVFNTNGEVIAQAKGASFPGGWVGGSCSFM